MDNWTELAITVGFSLYRLGSDHSTQNISCPAMNISDRHWKHLLQHRLYCCVRVLRALPRNGSTLLLVEYLLGACLPRRSLAMGLHVTIWSMSSTKLQDTSSQFDERMKSDRTPWECLLCQVSIFNFKLFVTYTVSTVAVVWSRRRWKHR
jgi:hypothetical protein